MDDDDDDNSLTDKEKLQDAEDTIHELQHELEKLQMELKEAKAKTSTSSSGSDSEVIRVAIVTGGARGIGRSITESLVACGDYQGYILTYNTNAKAAEDFVAELKSKYPAYKFCITGGDLTLVESRNAIFDLYDQQFASSSANTTSELALLVANAGQFCGVTSDNSNGLPPTAQKFGDGSLLLLKESTEGKDPRVDVRYLNYYHALYGEAYVDLCEQSLKRMRDAHTANPTHYRGCIVGMSAPGVLAGSGKLIDGYDIAGNGKALMEQATRYYALNCARYNINVNTLAAGYTKSDAWTKIVRTMQPPQPTQSDGDGKNNDANITEEFLKAAAQQNVPMGTYLEGRDLGDWVVFLASRGGGKFMTGQSIVIDGGMHLK